MLPFPKRKTGPSVLKVTGCATGSARPFKRPCYGGASKPLPKSSFSGAILHPLLMLVYTSNAVFLSHVSVCLMLLAGSEVRRTQLVCHAAMGRGYCRHRRR